MPMSAPRCNSEKLSHGIKVALASGKVAVVIKWMAEGTQGHVYRAIYDGDEVCLKIFKDGSATTVEQRMHLIKYAAQGRPTKNFVKVVDIVPAQSGNIPAGYVMEMVDTSSLSGSDSLTQLKPLPSLRVLIDLALILIYSLKALHSRGLAYLDLSNANVLFDFMRGHRLKFLDPDNITPDGMPVGIYGTLGYMAPEVIKKNAPPSVLTDLYSGSILVSVAHRRDAPALWQKTSSVSR